MSRQRTLSFFPTQNYAGQALRKEVERLVLCLGFKLNRIISFPTVIHVAYACWNDDVVIFDGSIEEDGHNYKIAFESLKSMEHVLLVSRTPLPLNFFKLKTRGVPDHPHLLNNEAILGWLAQKLVTMPFRAWSEKGFLFHMITQFYNGKRVPQYLKRQRKIFISYRSHYKDDIRKLQKRLTLGDFHQNQSQTMFFFSPGSLAFKDEVISLMRRWQILRLIRDYIYECEEFWIYMTNDYLDSWWTRCELATFIYCGDAGKRIRLYDAKYGTIRDISPSELPKLTKEEHDCMTSWFVNSNPMIAGAVSIIGSCKFVNFMRKFPFFNYLMWNELFQRSSIIQCSSERCKTKSFELSECLTFDMKSLLQMCEDDLFFVESQRLEQITQEEEILHCPYCHTAYKVIREPLDRYLYLAFPISKGPKGKNLQEVPVYRSKRI